MSDDENELDEVKKIKEDAEQRTEQFADVLIRCGQGQEVENAMAHFWGVSNKLRNTEFKLHLAELKLNMIESRLAMARETIQTLYEIATEAPRVPIEGRPHLLYRRNQTEGHRQWSGIVM